VNVDPYSNKVDWYFSSSRPEMLRYVPEDVKDVLEVGCGGGGFAAAVKAARRARVTAIEPFEAAAAVAATRLDEVVRADAHDGLSRLRGRQFDCIVFNDVLEHLVNPESALTEAAPLLRRGGVVVASIPNMRYLPVLRGLVLHGEWRYAKDGVLDRTHLRFYTAKSIAEMFAECGYRVRTLEGINSHPLSWKYRLLNLLASNAFDDTRHFQFAVVATLEARPQTTARADRPIA
jgi:2-polyprenyl-3-methyl-5-hydroxy-6-metoxy-1,4-benzoquinol methylase